MSLMADGNEELLDYVIEKDMEDTVSRVILSSLETLEKGVGRKRLTKVLRGKDPGFLMDGREALRPSFGRLGQLDEDQVLDFLESLIRLGLVDVLQGELPTIAISERGRKVLRSRDMVPAMIPWPLPSKHLPIPCDRELYDRLKDRRNEIARNEGIPPYCVVPNITLVEMVNRNVSELEKLLDVPGVGPSRLEKYGRELLSVMP